MMHLFDHLLLIGYLGKRKFIICMIDFFFRHQQQAYCASNTLTTVLVKTSMKNAVSEYKNPCPVLDLRANLILHRRLPLFVVLRIHGFLVCERNDSCGQCHVHMPFR